MPRLKFNLYLVHNSELGTTGNIETTVWGAGYLNGYFASFLEGAIQGRRLTLEELGISEKKAKRMREAREE